MARSAFLRGLAIVYFIAFLSLLPQVNGLVGANGILPVRSFLPTVHEEYGTTAYLYFPTLAWLSSSNTFLHVLIWSGVLLSVALFVRVLPLPVTVALYVLYLSMDTVGQVEHI